MSYVDGFVIVVPTKNIAAYKKMAQLGKKIWMKHGALDYKECVGDDLHPKMDVPDMPADMKPSSFPEMTNLKKGETVVFSYIVFKSKAHRDAVNKKVMKDPAMSPEDMKDMTMPFDMKRMAYGGFKTIVEL